MLNSVNVRMRGLLNILHGMLAAGRHKRISEVQRTSHAEIDEELNLTADNVREFCGVDIAAGNDADNLAGAGLAGESAGDGAGAGAFCDDVIARDEEAECFGDGVEIGDQRSIDQLPSAFEHLWEDGFRSDAVYPRWLVSNFGRSSGG